MAFDACPEIVASAADRFQDALDRVERRLHERRFIDGSLQDRALVALREVRACVGGILDGADATRCVAAFTPTPMHLRLVDALRRDVLESDPCTSEVEARCGLLVVRALERARDAAQKMEADDLRIRLSQPDAFDLLVEVAHDLRSPLNSVLFLSETLRRGHSGPMNEQQRSQLGLIYSAALGLSSMVTDIMDHSNEVAFQTGEPEPYLLSELFTSVLEMLGPVAEEKGIDLRASLPEYDRSSGHPAQLGRVILNLATNALKFTEEGYVEMGAKRRSEHRVEFYVRDTGRGISPERQKDLFQPFKRRLERDGEFFSSGGLGLTIARRLVRAVGSELEFETREGWGSRFFFVVREPAAR